MAIRIDLSDLIGKRSKLQKLVDSKVLEVTQKVTLDAGANLIAASPVDTGKFRGAWDIKTPEKAYQSGEITNPTPYGPALVNGHSNQAPAGWVPNGIEAAVKFGGK